MAKPLLTAAITRSGRLIRRYCCRFRQQHDRRPKTRERGITISTAHVEYETANRTLRARDCPGHADYVKNMITRCCPDGRRVLVVNASDGPMPQTREPPAMPVSRRACACCLHEQVDQVDDEEILELVEMEIRELLSKSDFPARDIPIVRGSALAALEVPRRHTCGKNRSLR